MCQCLCTQLNSTHSFSTFLKALENIQCAWKAHCWWNLLHKYSRVCCDRCQVQIHKYRESGYWQRTQSTPWPAGSVGHVFTQESAILSEYLQAGTKGRLDPHCVGPWINIIESTIVIICVLWCLWWSSCVPNNRCKGFTTRNTTASPKSPSIHHTTTNPPREQ